VLVAHPSADLYGSDRLLLESVEAMVVGGAEVTVVVPSQGPLVPLLQRRGARVLLLDVPVLRRGYLSPKGLVVLAGKALRSLPACRRLLREAGVELLYVNTLTLPTWALAARTAGRPVVVHVHEAEDRVGRALRALLHLPLLLAHRVVVNSDATRRSVVAAVPALARRTRTVHNGVPDQGGAAAPLPEQPPEQLRLVIVGRLSPVKGTDLALEALRQLAAHGVAASLTLVGDVYPGYEWFRDQLQRTASADDLAGRVHFAGFQPDVGPFLAQADVVLVPSRLESFGNVAVEAAFLGRPVVAARVQGLAEVVDHGSTGLLVPSEDPRALAEAVESLLHDWPTARRYGAAARTRALERFGVQRYRDELLVVLDELTLLPRRAAPGVSLDASRRPSQP
jgi:glycosyltransferase involved in cell wall biosynthesis